MIMGNKYRVFNKIISTMQQRFETTQYYRTILQESGNDIDEAIVSLIEIQNQRIESLIDEDEYDSLQVNMLASHIKELEALV